MSQRIGSSLQQQQVVLVDQSLPQVEETNYAQTSSNKVWSDIAPPSVQPIVFAQTPFQQAPVTLSQVGIENNVAAVQDQFTANMAQTTPVMAPPIFQNNFFPQQ